MKFYNIANHDESQKTAVIQIMEQIGYDWWTDKGVEATNFINDVRNLGELDSVFLEINSPGGNVYDGVSIANFIKNHSAKWSACVIGQAASIATVIASACDEIEMGLGTNYLVHKPMSAMFGYVNADECRALADNLDTIENSVIDFYLARIESKGKTKAELLALMREDRYMSADEAMEWGFVDSKSVDIKAVAFVDAKQAAKMGTEIPLLLKKQNELETTIAEQKAKLEAIDLAKQPVNAETVSKMCTEAKVPYLINSMIESKLSKEAFDKSIEQINEIKTICEASEIKDQEAILSKFNDAPQMLRHAILEAIALSELEQDPSNPSGMDDSKVLVIDTNKIYQNRNKG